MADLSIDFEGIKSPNPFRLASAPPPKTAESSRDWVAQIRNDGISADTRETVMHVHALNECVCLDQSDGEKKIG